MVCIRKRSIGQTSCFNPITNVKDSVGFSKGKFMFGLFVFAAYKKFMADFSDYVLALFTVE